MKDYPNSHPFDVTVKVGNREHTWQRYAPNLQAATDSAKQAIAKTYGGRGKLVQVRPHQTRWTFHQVETGRNGFPDWNTYAVRDRVTNVHVASVGNVDRYYESKTEEHARLIAAAPELLAALELCATRIFNYQAGMDELREPEATRQLNEEAWQAANAALRAAKV